MVIKLHSRYYIDLSKVQAIIPEEPGIKVIFNNDKESIYIPPILKDKLSKAMDQYWAVPL